MDEFKDREKREDMSMLKWWRMLEPKYFKYINMGITLICVLMFMFLYFKVKQAAVIIKEDIKSSTVYIHDTTVIRIEPPKVYQCWDCKNVLNFVSNNATCCGFTYHILDGKLIGEK